MIPVEKSALPALRPTNRYLLHWIRGQAGPGSRVLDFGCGNGAVVFAARAEGFDAYGAETYYDGARPEDLELVRTFDPDGSLIRTITGGVLNFPDASFDLVVANQVFEHVWDLEAAARELHRVLRPGGMLLSVFPIRCVVREPHLNVPLIHRLSSGRLRRSYARLARRLGWGIRPALWGTGEAGIDKAFWFLDEHVHYRTLRQVRAIFAPWFVTRFLEEDYLAFRLALEEDYLAFRLASRVPTSRFPGVRPLARAFTRLAASTVLEGTRR